jgi:hypothetical protein
MTVTVTVTMTVTVTVTVTVIVTEYLLSRKKHLRDHAFAV